MKCILLTYLFLLREYTNSFDWLQRVIKNTAFNLCSTLAQRETHLLEIDFLPALLETQWISKFTY